MQPNSSITASVALYCRVSTDEQAERGTIQDQRDFLRKYAELHRLTIVDMYEDDGVSGSIPLEERPDGQRLLRDAQAGRFARVIVYRLDRLGRSLRALIGAHDQLEAAGVAITSGTEPFDTNTSIGRLVFQLLGSLSEYEKESIRERTTNGRDRLAREGRYVGGVIPFGYDLDADRRLVPSERLVPQLSMSEADVVRDLYRRLVAGSTLAAETRRLSGLGVVSCRRYGDGGTAAETSIWTVTRLSSLVKSAVYRGEHTYKSRRGAIARDVPALVDDQTWAEAVAALARNRRMAKRENHRTYPLRGLIRCAGCRQTFHGAQVRVKGRTYLTYRCHGQHETVKEMRCTAKILRAPDIEASVWSDCCGFIRNPGEHLADAQRQLRERIAQTADSDRERYSLLAALREKEAEKNRVITLYRKGHIDDARADEEMGAIAAEVAVLQAELASVNAQEAVAQAAEEHLRSVASMLTRLQETLDVIEATDDAAAKAGIIRLLVREIVVTTTGTGRPKRATVAVKYVFAPECVDELGNPVVYLRP